MSHYRRVRRPFYKLFSSASTNCPRRELWQSCDLTSTVNSSFDLAAKDFGLAPARVGAALTSLGLTDRQRTNTGWYLVLDTKAQKHIHELIAAYGN